MSQPFASSRSDGRSDRQVLFDLVESADPDTLVSYDRILSALSDGLSKPVAKDRAYRAVASVNKILLRERRRYLRVVPNQGYRVIRSDEHLPEALAKKSRAQSYISRGVELLRNARLDELTEAQRTLHEGQLMVLAGLHQAVQESTARHDKQERVLDELRRRVEKLEGE